MRIAKKYAIFPSGTKKKILEASRLDMPSSTKLKRYITSRYIPQAWAGLQAGTARALQSYGLRLCGRAAGSKSQELAALKFVLRTVRNLA